MNYEALLKHCTTNSKSLSNQRNFQPCNHINYGSQNFCIKGILNANIKAKNTFNKALNGKQPDGPELPLARPLVFNLTQLGAGGTIEQE